MSEEIKNQIIVLEPSTRLVQEVLVMIEQSSVAELVRTETPEMALQEISAALPCLLIVSILDNQEVASHIQFFKRLEASVRQYGLKVCVVTPLRNPQLAELATKKLGISEFIIEPIPARNFYFKLNMMLRSIDNFRQQQDARKVTENKMVVKKLATSDRPASANAAPEIGIKIATRPALVSPQDVFLFKNSQIKKSGDTYKIAMEGPDPESGEWIVHDCKGEAATSWRWVPKDGQLIPSEKESKTDGWVHEGEEPAYDYNEKKWILKSKNPSLAWQTKGRKTVEKVGQTESGEVFVTDDSKIAETNLEKNREYQASVRPKNKSLAKRSKQAAQSEDEIEQNSGPLEDKETQDAQGREPPSLRDSFSVNKSKRKNNSPALETESESEILTEVSEEKETERRSSSRKHSPSSETNEAPWIDDFVPVEESGESKASVEPEGEDEETAGPEKKNHAHSKAAIRQRNSAVSPPAAAADSPDGEERSRDSWKTNKPQWARKLKNKMAGASEEQSPKSESPEANERDDADDELNSEHGSSGLPSAYPSASKRELEEAKSEAEQRASSSRNSSPGQNRKEAIRAARKKIVAAIRSILSAEADEEMSQEEEHDLREQLGLRGRPEAGALEPSRKKRLKIIKELKEKLSTLDQELATKKEEEKGSFFSNSEVSDTASPELRKGNLAAEKLIGIRRAIDGEELKALGESSEKKKLPDLKSEKGSSDFSDLYQYLPEADLQPPGNAWEQTGEGYYAYLDWKSKYRGFSDLADLLPVWIFSGQETPKFITKSKEWRFRGDLPTLARSIAEIPDEVKEFLLGLQKKSQLGASQLRNRKPSAVSHGNLDSEPAKDEALSRSSADPQSLKRLGGGISEESGEVKNSWPATGEADVVGNLDAELVENTNYDDAEESSEPSAQPTEGESAASPSPSAESKMLNSMAEESTEEKERGGRQKKAPSHAPESSDEKTEKSSNQSSELAEQEKELKQTSGATHSQAKSKNPQSEAVKKFLERRKSKNRAEGKSAAQTEKVISQNLEEKQPIETSPTSEANQSPPVYLGIYVALADAYGYQGDPARGIHRVLRALQDSFEECEVFCLQPREGAEKELILASSPSPDSTPEELDLSMGVKALIPDPTSDGSKVLGYLFLRFKGDRKSLSSAEQDALQQVAIKLWPLLIRYAKNSEKKAA